MTLDSKVNRTQVGIYTVLWRYEIKPLGRQVRSFASDDLKVVSPSQLAFAQTNARDGTFERYSRTTGDVLYYAKNNKFIIFPEGTIRDLVGIIQIVDAHRQGKEYVIPENQRDGIYKITEKMLKEGTAFAVDPGTTMVNTSGFRSSVTC